MGFVSLYPDFSVVFPLEASLDCSTPVFSRRDSLLATPHEAAGDILPWRRTTYQRVSWICPDRCHAKFSYRHRWRADSEPEGQVIDACGIRTPLKTLLNDVSASVDIVPKGIDFVVDLPSELIVT